MALGATPRSVHTLVFRQGFLAVGMGLIVGLGLTVLIMPMLRGVLVGLESGNTEHFLFAAGLVVLLTGIACWIPARRATKIDPMSALRHE